MISVIETISIEDLDAKLANNNGQNSEALSLQKEKLKQMVPLKQTLDEELNQEAKKVLEKESEARKANILQLNDLKKYEIKGNDSEWNDALKIPSAKSSSYITVKR